MPEIFDRVAVWWFSRRLPPVDWIVPKNCCAFFDVCLGSLSCIKQCMSGYTVWMKGNKFSRRMSRYRSASVVPSNIHSEVGPLRLIPAQTWTWTWCLGLYAKWHITTVNANARHIFMLPKLSFSDMQDTTPIPDLLTVVCSLEVLVCGNKSNGGFPFGHCTRRSI